VFLQGRKTTIDPLDVEVDRLLAKHGLAHLRGRRDQIDMRVGGGRDHDRVDLRVAQGRRRIRCRARAYLVCQIIRRL
jgi:hypothetical protein